MAELADLATAALAAALAIARAGLPPGAAPVPAGRHRDGQGRRPGAQLRQRRRRDLRGRARGAGRAGRTAAEAAALRTATALASGMIRVCSQTTAEGALFPVDPNLRPEGRNGPLVRTRGQPPGLLRALGQDLGVPGAAQGPAGRRGPGLGAEYLAAVGPMVWQAAQRPDFVADVQAMRRRVLGSLPADEAGRELKLGPGGLRDIEFAVQLLQLVHGRTDESLRVAGTLAALARAGRRRLRGPGRRRQPGRRLRVPAPRRAPAPAAPAAPHPHAARGPGGAAPGRPGAAPDAARGDGDAAGRARRPGRRAARAVAAARRRGPAAAREAVLPAAAGRGRPAAGRGRPADPGRRPWPGWRRSATPTRPARCGTSRRSARACPGRRPSSGRCCRCCSAGSPTPPLPDAGLLAFRQVSEALGDSPWYLRLLRDNTLVAQRMARVLASSRYATGLLLRAPGGGRHAGRHRRAGAAPGRAAAGRGAAAVGRHR